MSTITYQFRTVGAEAARRELLAQAAAARELNKAQRDSARVSAPVARRVGSGSDPQVKAEQARTKALAAEAKKRQREEAKRASEWTRGNDKMLRAREQHAHRETRSIEQAQKRQAAAIQRGHNQRLAQAGRVEKQMRYRQTMAYEARAESIKATRAARFEAFNDTVAGGAMAAVGIGAAATRSYMANQQRSRDLAVGGGQPDQAAALLANAEKTAKSVTGTRTEDILAGQQRIVAMTGNMDLARNNGRTMAQASRATGASEEDIGSLIATLNTKFGMTDPNEIKTAIANAISQGKSGAFEMKDAASYMSEMGAAGQRFGLDKGGTGFAKLGAMAQVARGATGSGAEASTATQAMLRQFISKSDEIKQMNGGKDVVFADKGRTKTNDIVDVIAGTIKAAGGDRKKLQHVFRDEGSTGASGYIVAFNEAADALGKNATEAERMAAGEAAIRKMFETATSAGSNWGDVVQDAAARTDSSEARMTTAWDTIVTSVGSAVTPSLEKLSSQSGDVGAVFAMLAEQVGGAIGAIGDLIGTLRRLGIMGEATPTDRAGRLDEIRGDKADLEKSAADGTLGNVGKKRLKQLTEEEGKLVNDMAKDMGLTSGTDGKPVAPIGPDAGPRDLASQFANYGFSASNSDITLKEQARMAEGPKKGNLDFTPSAMVQKGLEGLNTDQGGEDLKSAASDLKGAAKAIASSTMQSGNPLGAIWAAF